MRPSPLACGILLASFALYAQVTDASERVDSGSLAFSGADNTRLSSRDGHSHHHGHAEPLLELNETEVTLYHAPTPASFYTFDWEDSEHTSERHRGTLILHAVAMSLAFFVALPVGTALRAVKHPWHAFAIASFYGLVILGCVTGGMYKKLTPDMYEGSKHGSQGYIVLALSVILTIIGCLSVIRRVFNFVRSGEKLNLRSLWRSTVVHPKDSSEYFGLISAEPDVYEEEDTKPNSSAVIPLHTRRLKDINPIDVDSSRNPEQWANEVQRHAPPLSARSHSSEDTLHEGSLHRHSLPKPKLLHLIGGAVFGTAERVLIFAGWAQFITGVVVYTGGCRGNYLNGCLAHLIKGSIFWVYGLVTFARFLGSFSEYGWAWNRSPAGSYVSAEFVESLVIFLYGVTQTWMERFGAKRGDPYTTKQIQHIGIAVMFWFAGLVGIGIESKRLRRLLAASTVASMQLSIGAEESVSEPSSYASSFNPFPALVIGVTGAAMAAHFQTYLFQVQIHALWGNMLVAFAVIRCLTYFFLWLRPPQSILPSRPPTEALGSFFLACGGLVFMFSTEEVTIAAMRRGRDDVMMFMCVAIAMTLFAFCWTMGIVAFKGVLKSRLEKPVSFFPFA